MKEKVFASDNLFFIFMGRMADYVILNLLFIATAWPIVTAGSAIHSLLYVMKKISEGTEGKVIRTYMQEFIRDIKERTGLWILLLAVGILLIFDLWIANDYLTSSLQPVFLAATGALLFLWLMTLIWSVQQNGLERRLSAQLKKAFYMAVRFLPYTLLMLVILLIPVMICLLNFRLFATVVLPLYICLGFSITAAAWSRIESCAREGGARNYPTEAELMKSMKQNPEVKKELTETLIPYWKGMRDQEYGGYYGYMGADLQIEKTAVKGCILNSRILWFFSNAYLLLKDESLLFEAQHAYSFLKNCCLDHEKEGVFWSVRYDGTPEDTTKHTYNQAFAVYALSSYYEASKDPESLRLAEKLFHVIEDSCRDEDGYLEAFNRDFIPESNEKLSENGVMADRTMNTLLHVMEAYTELYKVSGNKQVAKRIRKILDLFADKIYNRKLHRQEVFFDKEYRSLIDLHSYGHDIESSWLLYRTLEILQDKEYTRLIAPIADALAEEIYRTAYDGHSLANECEKGKVDEDRVWWVQAEGIIGFLNSYQKNTANLEYLKAAGQIWEYILTYLKDGRPESEWFWLVDQNGKPDMDRPIADPWKCPYHNGRMCIEVLRRGIKITR